MRTTSPLVLDVHEVLEQPGSRRAIAFDTPVPDLRSGLTSVPADVHLDLTLEAIEGGVYVRGEFSGTAVAECRRCLKPVEQPFRFEAAELYRPPGDVWEEGYVIKDGTVDLEPMALDTIGLNLATSPLCREDCAGLCTSCGKDLNEGPCDCADEIDPRWSALQELKGQVADGHAGA
jgi:uncharacterized protein